MERNEQDAWGPGENQPIELFTAEEMAVEFNVNVATVNRILKRYAIAPVKPRPYGRLYNAAAMGVLRVYFRNRRASHGAARRHGRGTRRAG